MGKFKPGDQVWWYLSAHVWTAVVEHNNGPTVENGLYHIRILGGPESGNRWIAKEADIFARPGEADKLSQKLLTEARRLIDLSNEIHRLSYPRPMDNWSPSGPF